MARKDVLCSCGHSANTHGSDCGCFSFACSCSETQSDVLYARIEALQKQLDDAEAAEALINGT